MELRRSANQVHKTRSVRNPEYKAEDGSCAWYKAVCCAQATKCGMGNRVPSTVARMSEVRSRVGLLLGMVHVQ